jgi:hypothetical protein
MSIGKSLSPGIGSGIGSDSDEWSWSDELELSGSFVEAVVLLVELVGMLESVVLVELSVVELSDSGITIVGSTVAFAD